jgi:predicted DNA-binding protein
MKQKKQKLDIRLEPETRARLDALTDATGHSVAAIIRHCIDKHLPVIEQAFGTSPKVPLTSESK